MTSGIETPVLASACLCGVPCRYDGKNVPHPLLEEMAGQGLAIPVCPELLAGLSAPREPNEIRDGRVLDALGCDLTEAFATGAAMVLALAQEKGITVAVLKDKSPSCGSTVIYDGTFSGKMIPGEGVCAALLRESGIRVLAGETFTAGML